MLMVIGAHTLFLVKRILELDYETVPPASNCQLYMILQPLPINLYLEATGLLPSVLAYEPLWEDNSITVQ